MLYPDPAEKLIEQFYAFPDWVVGAAYLYADSLVKYGVDVTKIWETVSAQKAALDEAYKRGRMDEAARWQKAIEGKQ